MAELTDMIKEYDFLLSALSEKSGEDIVLMKLGDGALADVFILVTGNSDVHLRTLTDAAEEALERRGITCRAEGESSSNWRLIDAGELAVHIFSRKGRDFYKLDKLWSDAKTYRFDDSPREL